MTTVYPFNLRFGSFNITGYGIMMMAGFLMGGWLIDRELRRRGWYHEYAANITVAAVIGGVLGAKIWYVIAIHDWKSLFTRGGLVWYGGFLGGAAVVLFQGWLRKVPLRWTLEVTAPALAAAYSLGRLGCFLVGDDYGIPSQVPWAVKFPQGLPPTTAGEMARQFGVPLQAGVTPDTVLAVHPTQLYEASIMMATFMVLWRLRKHIHAPGWLFGVYLMMAGTERFLVEFLRAKEDHFLGALTVAQGMALAIIVLGAILVTRWKEGELAPGAYLSTGKKS